MPTYVYKCPVHGEFDVEQRITDPKLKFCLRRVEGPADQDPWVLTTWACGQPLERLISGGTGFQLKGSGWAKDGYK